MTRNAANPAQIARQDKDDKLAARQQRRDLQVLLARPDFKRVVWQWLSFTGIYRDTFDTNALSMAKAAGIRAVGLYMLAEISAADPAALVDMMKERQPEQKEQDDDGTD